MGRIKNKTSSRCKDIIIIDDDGGDGASADERGDVVDVDVEAGHSNHIVSSQRTFFELLEEFFRQISYLIED